MKHGASIDFRVDSHEPFCSFDYSQAHRVFRKIKKKLSLGLDNCSTPTGNSAYASCGISSEDIVITHDTFMKPPVMELSDDEKRLPYLYWTPSSINLQ